MSMGVSGVGGGGEQWPVSGASGNSSPVAKMSDLFSRIDTAGGGTIDQDQFNQAFATQNPPGVFKAAGANYVFSQLDSNGTGSVSQANFVSGMTSLMRSLRGGGTEPGSATSPADTLASSLRSLNQLGNSPDASASDGVGNIVDLIA